MELQTTNIESNVPVVLKEFKKSKIILVLAYIHVVIFISSVIILIIAGAVVPHPNGIIESFFGQILFVLFFTPSFVIVFLKNEKAYGVAKILIILEYLIIPVGALILLIFPSWIYL